VRQAFETFADGGSHDGGTSAHPKEEEDHDNSAEAENDRHPCDGAFEEEDHELADAHINPSKDDAAGFAGYAGELDSGDRGWLWAWDVGMKHCGVGDSAGAEGDEYVASACGARDGLALHVLFGVEVLLAVGAFEVHAFIWSKPRDAWVLHFLAVARTNP
jgi:hypothetical protein